MSFSKLRVHNVWSAAAFCGLLAGGLAQSVMASTLCVNPGGTTGCYATIGAAVTAAAANDTINVSPGQYNEDVAVNKPLTLVGSGSNATIINAKGLANGIYVNGLDNGGLFGVTVTGFTVMNANFEGILLTNTSYSLIANNRVINNNQSLNFASGSCPGLPIFETSEGEDCGEGIHLVGVHHTTVANNVSQLNSGGMLLSDETGMTYANNITGNSVQDNALDCGITLASHPPSPQASSMAPYGVFNNNMIGNHVTGNGLAGEGAGIGIFAPGPGNLAFGNHVIGNVIEGNGLPGVTMHNHAAPPGAPGINLNDTVIQGNFISGNGADVQDSATPGPTGINIYSVAPVYAMSILDNTIQNEALDVVMNNPGVMDLHLNNLLGTGVGVANLGNGVVNGSLNYFGCAAGPGNTGCSTVKGSATTTPFLSAPAASAPAGASKGR